MKRVIIIVLIGLLSLTVSCGNKYNSYTKYLEKNNIMKTDIVKVYKPILNQETYICLYEKESDDNSTTVTGGLILINKKAKSGKYYEGYSQSRTYDRDISEQTFFTYYFKGPDTDGLNHNYVIGGRFKSDNKGEFKPYIEFSNGDILLIDNYQLREGIIFFYIDIGTNYIIKNDDNSTSIMDFKLKTISK